MNKIKTAKIVQFKSCTEKEIADAILQLSKPLMAACGDNQELKKMIIPLTVTGWNLSLFPEEDGDFTEKIEKRLPENLSEANRKVFIAFVNQIIIRKQALFPDMKKGVISHEISFENGETVLKVKTLPVKPQL